MCYACAAHNADHMSPRYTVQAQQGAGVQASSPAPQPQDHHNANEIKALRDAQAACGR